MLVKLFFSFLNLKLFRSVIVFIRKAQGRQRKSNAHTCCFYGNSDFVLIFDPSAIIFERMPER